MPLNVVTEDIIDRVWNRAQEYPEEALNSLLEQFGDEQPLITTYLVSIGEDVLDDDEVDVLLFIGQLLWQMLKESGELPEVTEHHLNDVQAENAQLLDMLMEDDDSIDEDEAEARFKAAMKDYAQQPMLDFTLEVIASSVEEGDIRPENFGNMVLYLKVMLDAFQKAA